MTRPDDSVKTALRLPRSLRDELKISASAAGRSMNDEIVARVRLEPQAVAATAILRKIENYEALGQSAEKRRSEALWRLVERMNVLLDRLEPLIRSSAPEDMGEVRRELELIKELVKTHNEYR